MGIVAFLAAVALAAVLAIKAFADPPALRLGAIFLTLKRWLGGPPERRPYLRVLSVFALVVAPFWCVLIFLTAATVLRLYASLPEIEPEALRWHTLAIGTMIVALAGLIGAPLALIRVWTTERQTDTVEQSLITDLINKAVEGLAAEKRITRIGRLVTFRLRRTHDKEPETSSAIEWEGEPLDPPDGFEVIAGKWSSFDRTVPNIEVRIGAILSLERVARTSNADHIRIMEILCAYIRENAPATTALSYREQCLQSIPHYMPESVKSRLQREIDDNDDDDDNRIEYLIQNERLTRPDISAAITTIGRRAPSQIDIERGAHRNKAGKHYRLDLRGVNLRRADLTDLDLSHAVLDAAHLEGSDLRRTRLHDASLNGAHFQGANLEFARLLRSSLVNADLSAANLRFCDLREVDWHFTRFGNNIFHSADLRGAKRLEQGILRQSIGDINTLLPDFVCKLGDFYYVLSKWPSVKPKDFDTIVNLAAGPYASSDEILALEKAFVSNDHTHQKTGTPLALDASRPPGHPLGDWD